MKEDWNNISQDKMKELKKTMEAFGQAADPDWFDGTKIDEIAFCSWLLEKHPMKCIRDRLYDIDGYIGDDNVKSEIFSAVCPYIKTNVAKNVEKYLNALKLMAMSDELPIETDRIHLHNGTYFLRDRRFTTDRTFCTNRLPVSYRPDAAKPGRWTRFLHELLYPEDIPTLQEFIGYCLIPTNAAQKMLLILGNGGEGKSRLGRVLRALLGNNMTMSSLQKLATNQFARADQEGMLLMLDDDMKMEALPDTNTLKVIVTLEGKIDLERKGKQSVQGDLYCRLMGLGNGSLTALYDKSDGFYRRQIVLQTRDRDENRVDDYTLGDKLAAEAEGILLWALEGLHRLIENGYRFTISERARGNLEAVRRDDNNILSFLESEGYVLFEEGTHATSRKLYEAYRRWCGDNVEKPLAERTFTGYLKKNESKLGISYSQNIRTEDGRTARGYNGIHVQVRTGGFNWTF